MSSRISTRISIRWPPEPASEPTDTLVLSLGGYYVDLRIDKATGAIDWALAGQRIVISEDPLKVEFTHPIDSHCANPSDEEHAGEADVGDFSKLPNGDDLETGEMAAPHLGGRIMPYEEVWRELKGSAANEPADPLSGGAEGWVLEAADEEVVKSFYARVGGFFLAVRRKTMGGSDRSGQRYEYSAVREEFDETTGKWNAKYAVGEVEGLLTMSQTAKESEGPTRWNVGETVNIGARHRCIVRAVSY